MSGKRWSAQPARLTFWTCGAIFTGWSLPRLDSSCRGAFRLACAGMACARLIRGHGKAAQGRAPFPAGNVPGVLFQPSMATAGG